jgi:hypothetical protein
MRCRTKLIAVACAVMALACTAVVTPALGAGNAIVNDCQSNGQLTHTYSLSQLRHALAVMSATTKQYTNCADVVQAAITKAKNRTGGAGSGGSGGSFLPTPVIVILVLLILALVTFGALAIRRRRADAAGVGGPGGPAAGDPAGRAAAADDIAPSTGTEPTRVMPSVDPATGETRVMPSVDDPAAPGEDPPEGGRPPGGGDEAP